VVSGEALECLIVKREKVVTEGIPPPRPVPRVNTVDSFMLPNPA